MEGVKRQNRNLEITCGLMILKNNTKKIFEYILFTNK